MVDGFVDLKDATGKIFVASQGSDLSSNNIVFYQELKGCGAAYTFVRIDDKFLSHYDSSKHTGMQAVPYFFFPVGKNRQNPNTEFSRMPKSRRVSPISKV